MHCAGGCAEQPNVHLVTVTVQAVAPAAQPLSSSRLKASRQRVWLHRRLLVIRPQPTAGSQVPLMVSKVGSRPLVLQIVPSCAAQSRVVVDTPQASFTASQVAVKRL